MAIWVYSVYVQFYLQWQHLHGFFLGIFLFLKFVQCVVIHSVEFKYFLLM